LEKIKGKKFISKKEKSLSKTIQQRHPDEKKKGKRRINSQENEPRENTKNRGTKGKEGKQIGSKTQQVQMKLKFKNKGIQTNFKTWAKEEG
jgi:hypothetical protein